MYKRIIRNLIFCSADTDSNFIGKGEIVNGSKLPDVIICNKILEEFVFFLYH